MGQSGKSVLLDNERYGRVLVVEIEILMPKMTLRLFKTEVNMSLLLPLPPPCPSYRSPSADRNLFRVEGVTTVQNPIFALALFCLRRNPYFRAVLRGSQSARPAGF